MVEEIVKVSCDFCGKEIECPEHMLDSPKHCCYECFQKIGDEIPKEDLDQIHVDMPLEQFMDDLASQATETIFPMIWSRAKKEKSNLSKKELAESMFYAGFSAAIDFMNGAMEDE